MKPTEVTPTATAEPQKGVKGERFSPEYFERMREQRRKLTKKPPAAKYPDLPSVGVKTEQFEEQVADVGSNELGSKEGQAVINVGQWKDTLLAGGKERLEKAREAVSKNKVFRFLKGAAESYLNKFDPRGKEIKAWGAGILGGFTSAVAVAEFGATLGFSPVVRALTVAGILNASDAIYYKLHHHYVSGALDKTSFRSETSRREVLKRIFELEKDVAAKGLKGEEFREEYDSGLTEILNRELLLYPNSLVPQHKEVSQTIKDKLLKYGKDYAVVTSTGRSLSAGMAVGSLFGALGEVGIRTVAKGNLGTAGEWIGERFGGGGQAAGVAQEITTIQPAPGVPTVEEGYLKAPPIPETVITQTQEKITSLAESPQFLEQKAATVGKFLDAREQLTRAALEAKGISLSEIDAVSFDKGMEAAQGVMESQINQLSDEVLRTEVSANPDATLADIAPKIEKAYTDWLSSETGQAQIQEAAQGGIADQLQVESQLVGKVSRVLENNPDLFREITVREGDTLGDLAGLNWTNADAPKIGAHLLVNWGPITDEYVKVVAEYPELLSNNPFLPSPSEITDLVNRMLAGDEEARRILIKAGYYIPAGSRFIILNDEGISTTLRSAAKLKMAA